MSYSSYKKSRTKQERAALRAALVANDWDNLDTKMKRNIPKKRKYATISA